jgi:hypothetical protein
VPATRPRLRMPCIVATADRGVARFAGLDWFDPLA